MHVALHLVLLNALALLDHIQMETNALVVSVIVQPVVVTMNATLVISDICMMERAVLRAQYLIVLPVVQQLPARCVK